MLLQYWNKMKVINVVYCWSRSFKIYDDIYNDSVSHGVFGIRIDWYKMLQMCLDMIVTFKHVCVLVGKSVTYGMGLCMCVNVLTSAVILVFLGKKKVIHLFY